jgi:uncharacterized protein YdeI (YjbR/CyaY-like superfamily)
MAKEAGILTRVKKLVRKHINWLVASILGTDSLTKEELASIEGSPLGIPSLDLVKRSFVLGKLVAKTPIKEQKKLTTSDLDNYSSEYTLTPLDKIALAYSKTRAATYVHSAADDMASSVLARLSKALGSTMIASAEEVIREEVKEALDSNKALAEFSSSLANKLQIDYKDRLIVIASTELHSARIQGTVQSIIQQQDVYKYGDGLDSFVSIVPKAGTCPDCAKHYLDTAGNPKIVKLSKLLSMGSNADPGTSHSKRRGIHTGWKTTLPPMHPSCKCEVVFIPHGFSWVKGELKLTHPRVFHKSLLRKATESKLSPVAKPPGPPQPMKPAKPGNIPGVAAPSSFGSADTIPKELSSAATGSGKEYYYAKPGEDTSGSGWESYKKRDGTSGMRKEVGSGTAAIGDDLTPENLSELVQQSKNYGKQDHPVKEVKEKLRSATIVATQELDQEAGTAKGVTDQGFIVVLQGGGRAIAKPKTPTAGVRNGMGGIIQGQGVYAEQAVDSIGGLLGLGGLTQPTVLRQHSGETHSVQAWNENASPLGKMGTSEGYTKGPVQFLLTKATSPKEAEALLDQVQTLNALALVTNMADQHADNVLFNAEDHTLHAIDNSASFGTGMAGTANTFMREANLSGRKLRVPDHLVDKFDKMSFSDVKKAMPEMKPWQATQTLMRMKYLSHLQKEEGHLDPKKFLPVFYADPEYKKMFEDAPDDVLESWSMPALAYWGTKDNKDKIRQEFADRRDAGTLPDDLFQNFMAEYFESNIEDLNDPSSETYQMLETGPFINPGLELHKRANGKSSSVEEQKDRLTYIRRLNQNKSTSELFPAGS